MKKNLKTLFKVAILGSILTFALAACGGNDNDNGDDYPPATNGSDAGPSAGQVFYAGSHTATEAGVWGFITVTLNTTETEITSVDIHHQETGLYVDSAFVTIQNAILETQDPRVVDTVVGATASTLPLLIAAEQAFLYAQGAPVTEASPFIPGTYAGIVRDYVGGIGEGETVILVTFNETDITNIEIISHMYTGETLTTEDEADLIAAAMAWQDMPVIEGAEDMVENFRAALDWAVIIASTPTTITMVEAPDDVDAGDLATGVYVYIAEGRNDYIVIIMGVLDGAIFRTALHHRETAAFVHTAFPQVLEAVVTGQTAQVDTIAGATFSTGLVIDGLQELVEQASN